MTLRFEWRLSCMLRSTMELAVELSHVRNVRDASSEYGGGL